MAGFIALGIVNWIATTIVVDSELFRPLRDWLDRAQHRWPGPEPRTMPQAYRQARLQLRHQHRVQWLLGRLRYLFGCHLCAGTWIALLEAGLFGTPWAGLAGLFAGALLIKGIGHLILELRPQAWVGARRFDSQGRPLR